MTALRDDGHNVVVAGLAPCPLCRADQCGYRGPYVRTSPKPVVGLLFEAKVVCGSCGLETSVLGTASLDRNLAVEKAAAFWNDSLLHCPAGTAGPPSHPSSGPGAV